MAVATSHSPELARLFDVCQRIELAYARLYRVLAGAHATSPRIAALWRKTANEEEAHAAQFRLASSTYSGAVDNVRIGIAEAMEMLGNVEATILRFQAEPPGIADALRCAIRMEEAMAGIHLDQLARFRNPTHKRLFRAMMSADEGHVEALREALAGVDEIGAR